MLLGNSKLGVKESRKRPNSNSLLTLVSTNSAAYLPLPSHTAAFQQHGTGIRFDSNSTLDNSQAEKDIGWEFSIIDSRLLTKETHNFITPKTFVKTAAPLETSISIPHSLVDLAHDAPVKAVDEIAVHATQEMVEKKQVMVADTAHVMTPSTSGTHLNRDKGTSSQVFTTAATTTNTVEDETQPARESTTERNQDEDEIVVVQSSEAQKPSTTLQVPQEETRGPRTQSEHPTFHTVSTHEEKALLSRIKLQFKDMWHHYSSARHDERAHATPTPDNALSTSPSSRPGRLQRFKEWIIPKLIIWRNRRDLWLLLYSIIYFLVCTYIVCLANSYSDRTNTNGPLPNEDRFVSPDKLLESSYRLFQKHDIPWNISDTFVQIAIALMLLRALVFKKWTVTILRRLFWIIASLYLLRALFVASTVLPSPWIECVYSYKENIFYDALLLLLQQRVSCGDVFYSGHTIMFMSMMVFFWTYNHGGNRPDGLPKNRPFLLPKFRAQVMEDAPPKLTTNWGLNLTINIIATMFSLTGMWTLILSSYHYTIDVLAAAIFTLSVWVVYHWCIRVPMLREETAFGRMIWFLDDPFYPEHSKALKERNGNTDVVTGGVGTVSRSGLSLTRRNVSVSNLNKEIKEDKESSESKESNREKEEIEMVVINS